MKNDVVAVHMLDPGVIFVRLQQYIISISNRRALNIFSPIKSDNSKVFPRNELKTPPCVATLLHHGGVLFFAAQHAPAQA